MNETRPKLAPQIQGLVPTLVEVGKIKIGKKGAWKKSSGGKEFQLPEKLDHFVVTTLERGEDGNFIKDYAVHQALGEKPTEIPIGLLYNDPTLNFQSSRACFVGNSCWCRGDGVNAYRKQQDGSETVVTCPCERAEPTFKKDQHKCKMSGVLSVVLDNMSMVGGVYKYRTTGFNSVVNLMSSLMLIHTITGGVLSGIPLVLAVRPKSAIIPATNKPTTIWTVGVHYKGSKTQLQECGYQIALKNQAYAARIEHIEETAKLMIKDDYQLTEGETEQDVAEEFYPESVMDETEIDPPQAGLPQNGKHADRISDTDRDVGKAQDPEPDAGRIVAEMVTLDNDPTPAKGTPMPETVAGKVVDENGNLPFDAKEHVVEHEPSVLPRWVLDSPRLDEFISKCAKHFDKTVDQIRQDAEASPEDFASAYKNWLGKNAPKEKPADAKPAETEKVAPESKPWTNTVWDPLTADLGSRYSAEKKQAVMEAMEARGMEVNPSHSGNKFHFLLLEDVKKRGIDIGDMPSDPPTENESPATQNGDSGDMPLEPELPPAPEDKAPEIETEDEFEMLVNTQGWQEMSMLKSKHFKLYAQVTGGKTPRTLEKVQYVIDEIVRLAAAGDTDGMPEA